MNEEERAEFCILGLMTKDTHKFAIDVFWSGDPAQHQALERMLLRDWIRLIDVSTVAHMPGHLLRIFLVRPEAVAWYWSHAVQGKGEA